MTEERVTTADYLRELADRARHMGDEGWGPLQPKQWRFFADWLGSLTEAGEPLSVLFRPDAPQPDTTDDTVERAARALFNRGGYSEESFDEISERLRNQVCRDARAVLAAAGAGAEVDREGMTEDQEACTCESCVHYRREAYLRGAADALAARGDVATPTEVEWGLRWPDGGVVAYGGEEEARVLAGHYDGTVPVLVQRTRSAWREVEGGGQRG